MLTCRSRRTPDKGEWIAGRSLHGEDPHGLPARTGPVTGDGPTSATSTLGFSIWPTQSSPIPIIRNEELILLRAEADWPRETRRSDRRPQPGSREFRRTAGVDAYRCVQR
jgi:hypothetical protein